LRYIFRNIFQQNCSFCTGSLFKSKTSTNREVRTLAMHGSIIDYSLIYSCLRVDDDNDDDDGVLATTAGRFGPRLSATIRELPHSMLRHYSRKPSRRTSHAARMITIEDYRQFDLYLRHISNVGHWRGIGREAAENCARGWLRCRQSEFLSASLENVAMINRGDWSLVSEVLGT